MPSKQQIDEYLVKVTRLIEEYGLAIQGVFGDPEGPGFQYTVGLARVGHPELIVFGLPHEIGQAILNDAGRRILRGELELAAGDTLHKLVRDFPVRLLPVADSREHLTVANRFYGFNDAPIPALQLVFPDDAYRWPWEEGSRTAGTPLLGPVPEDGRELTLPEED